MTRIVERLGRPVDVHGRPKEMQLIECRDCGGFIEMVAAWGCTGNVSCGHCRERRDQEAYRKARKRQAEAREVSRLRKEIRAIQWQLFKLRVARPFRPITRPIRRRLEAFTDWAEGRA